MCPAVGNPKLLPSFCQFLQATCFAHAHAMRWFQTSSLISLAQCHVDCTLCQDAILSLNSQCILFYLQYFLNFSDIPAIKIAIPYSLFYLKKYKHYCWYVKVPIIIFLCIDTYIHHLFTKHNPVFMSEFSLMHMSGVTPKHSRTLTTCVAK